LRQARIKVVSDPHTGPLHRGVRECWPMASMSASAQDDISDAYYPFGRNNMPKSILASHLLWMTKEQEIARFTI